MLHILTVLLAPSLLMAAQGGEKGVVPKLKKEEREAIIAAANRARNQYVKAEKKEGAPGEIPAALWGEAIAKLKPVRVRDDRVNVAIVLSEKGGAEEGLYVSIPVSSYAPMVGERFEVLEPLSAPDDRAFGTLYHYRLRPKAK